MLEKADESKAACVRACRWIGFFANNVGAMRMYFNGLCGVSQGWQDKLQAIDQRFKRLIDDLGQLECDVWEEFNRTGKPPFVVENAEMENEEHYHSEL